MMVDKFSAMSDEEFDIEIQKIADKASESYMDEMKSILNNAKKLRDQAQNLISRETQIRKEIHAIIKDTIGTDDGLGADLFIDSEDNAFCTFLKDFHD